MERQYSDDGFEKHFVERKLTGGLTKLRLPSEEKKLFTSFFNALPAEGIHLLYLARTSFEYDLAPGPAYLLPRFYDIAGLSGMSLYVWYVTLLTALNFHYDAAGRSARELAEVCNALRRRMTPTLKELLLINQNRPENDPLLFFDVNCDRAKLDFEAQWFESRFMPCEASSDQASEGDPRILGLLRAARHPFNNGPAFWEKKAPLLTLLHFSDAHASYRAMGELLSEASEYEGLFEDVLSTGDMVLTCNDAARDCYYQVPGIERVLNAVGNHDCLNNPFFDWSDRISMQEAARQFMDPFAENWGVVREPETTFYYKLYEPQRVMLLVLDSNLEGTDADRELAFVRSALNVAREKDFTVLAAVHEPPMNPLFVPCNFSAYRTEPHNACGPNLDRRIPKAIHEFSENGGKFSLFLSGHYHDAGVFADPEYPDQRYVVVGPLNAMKGMRSGTSCRLPGTESGLLANFVTLDTELKVVKLIRLGCTTDCLLRSQKYMTMNYETGEIIAFG